MADLSLKDALILTCGGSSGGGTVTNYDQLTNRPIQNVSGNPVIISKLPSGVYNIDGTWSITLESEQHATHKDDMFYVLNENGMCKMTWITAGEIYTYSSEIDDNKSSVVEDRVTKESDCKNHSDNLIGTFDESGSSGGTLFDWIGEF